MTKPIIDIVSASMPCEPEVVGQCFALLESWGFTPRYTVDLDSPKSPIGFYSEAVRFKHLVNAIQADDSSIIWALRGGYGLSPIAPALVALPKPQQKKLLIGFSDTTVLHIIASQHWNWKTVHGPVLFQAATHMVTPGIEEQLRSLVRGDLVETVIPIIPLNKAAHCSTSHKASITGGNLCLIQHSIGTNWQLDCRGKILFIEEVNETGYRIDRTLHHLEQAGVLEGCLALLVGDIDKSTNSTGEDIAPYVIDQWAHRLSIPVLRIPGFGHGHDNGLLPFNNPCTLSLGHSPTLTCLFR